MANYNFKVDLKGIIRLLSDNLYSSDKVFLRELLQNAVDAIDARKKADSSCPEGKITVTYRRKAKGAELVFADNGIGLTKEEIHSFLSVIGQSSKRT
ncbi:MAG: ATP-binding protein, partial [Lachnospiraceae bacterium]|nr:ATP-binding protein [Lachnospiraceae bacterium]